MPSNRLLCFFVGLALSSPVAAGAQENSFEAPDERLVWQYKMKGKSHFIVRSPSGDWQAVRPDDKKVTYAEIERNDSQIQIQNTASKLLVRLDTELAYWRQPKDEEWTRWVKGQWLADKDIPRAARAILTKKASVPAEPLTPSKPQPAGNAPVESVKKHEIRLAYFVPTDRQPTRKYEQKIRVVMAAVSELIRDDLRRRRFDTPGLAIESEDGKPKVHLLRGKHPAAHYNLAPNYDASKQYNMLMPEIREALGSPYENLYVVFTETWDPGPAKFAWPGVIARGGWYSARGGVAVYSTHILQDAFCATTIEAQRRLFFDATPIVGRLTMGHMKPNPPRFEFIEDGFGAVAHELGHALGLPHDRRRDDVSIMGNGFRNLRWNFAPRGRGKRVGFSDDNARFLAASRFLNPDANIQDNRKPEVTFRLERPGDGPPKLAVELKDDVGLKAMLYLDRSDGSLGAGSVVGGRALDGRTATFLDPIPSNLIRNGRLNLQLNVIDEGGNITKAREELRLGP